MVKKLASLVEKIGKQNMYTTFLIENNKDRSISIACFFPTNLSD